jgi:hypothetical protein
MAAKKCFFKLYHSKILKKKFPHKDNEYSYYQKF